MLLAVVSVGIVSSSAPLAPGVEGLQEVVELDSEVELLEPEHAAIVGHCIIVRRDTWYVAKVAYKRGVAGPKKWRPELIIVKMAV